MISQMISQMTDREILESIYLSQTAILSTLATILDSGVIGKPELAENLREVVETLMQIRG